jgi:hypothetical protein
MSDMVSRGQKSNSLTAEIAENANKDFLGFLCVLGDLGGEMPLKLDAPSFRALCEKWVYAGTAAVGSARILLMRLDIWAPLERQ